MGSDWAGLHVEIDGVRKAARNLKDNHRQLAAYVYERCSAFMGGEHEAIATMLIHAAIDEVASGLPMPPNPPSPTPAPRSHG